MSRAATISDVFNAIAEPRRREIIDAIGMEEKGVNELAALLKIAQPSVSKHLRVLKEVSILTMRRNGKERLYSLNPESLKPIHDWTSGYREYWETQTDSIKERAETIAKSKNEQQST